VLVIVINNATFGTIRMHQERRFPGRVSGTDLVNPDFAAFARSFGAQGATVRTPEEFADALARLWPSDGPVLIEIIDEVDRFAAQGAPLENADQPGTLAKPNQAG
jgi:acetolactate synthase-1/2/3 large subunit